MIHDDNLKINGWMDPIELDWLYHLAFTSRESLDIVEIGSWLGRSSYALASGIKDSRKETRLICIDSFQPVDLFQIEYIKKNDVIGEFNKNMSVFNNWKLIIKKSEDAILDFEDESLGIVFIDSDHKYDSVIGDIERWYEKVKKYCVICGHDYSVNYPDVIKAVNDFFGELNFDKVSNTSIWFKIKGVD